jgi:hypothetical protein
MKLKALTDLSFGGKTVKKGEQYDAGASMAKQHIACKLAEEAKDKPANQASEGGKKS